MTWTLYKVVENGKRLRIGIYQTRKAAKLTGAILKGHSTDTYIVVKE